jgi:hypothetical protein
LRAKWLALRRAAKNIRAETLGIEERIIVEGERPLLSGR